MSHDLIIKPKLQGYFKLDAIRPDGTVRPLTGWFPNLITDTGLNRIGTGSYLSACHVGTNNTAPTVANTILGGFVAGTTSIISTSSDAQNAEPYFGWKRRTYRFDIGVAAGNLSEVGIATARTNGGATILFSRALILDELGDPTTVTVLPDEILDVTYELRLYPPLVDVSQTASITGSDSHSILTRACDVTGTGWHNYLGNRATFDPSGGSTMSARSGELGSITGSPAGLSGSSSTCYNHGYSNNSLYLTGGANWSLGQGNVGGIRSVRWQTSLGMYQTRFDPVIDKTALKTLNLVFRIDWGRYT